MSYDQYIAFINKLGAGVWRQRVCDALSADFFFYRRFAGKIKSLAETEIRRQ